LRAFSVCARLVALRNAGFLSSLSPGVLGSAFRLTGLGDIRIFRPPLPFERAPRLVMKVVNSLKSAKKRHKDSRIVRRKGRVYVINKTNPRFKARQG